MAGRATGAVAGVGLRRASARQFASRRSYSAYQRATCSAGKLRDVPEPQTARGGARGETDCRRKRFIDAIVGIEIGHGIERIDLVEALSQQLAELCEQPLRAAGRLAERAGQTLRLPSAATNALRGTCDLPQTSRQTRCAEHPGETRSRLRGRRDSTGYASCLARCTNACEAYWHPRSEWWIGLSPALSLLSPMFSARRTTSTSRLLPSLKPTIFRDH